jgi:hypothetical protein
VQVTPTVTVTCTFPFLLWINKFLTNKKNQRIMQTVAITASQLKDLFEYTEFNTNIWVEDLLEKDTVKSVEIFEDGRIDIHHTGHIENHGIWDIKGRQDFDLLVRLIDSEFGIEGMTIDEIYTAINNYIDTSWNPQSYEFFFNVDSDNECADYQGLSPREALEAIQKYIEA